MDDLPEPGPAGDALPGEALPAGDALPGDALPGDDRHCPRCGSGDYWLYETEKECKACGASWLSAWSLAHNDGPPPA